MHEDSHSDTTQHNLKILVVHDGKDLDVSILLEGKEM